MFYYIKKRFLLGKNKKIIILHIPVGHAIRMRQGKMGLATQEVKFLYKDREIMTNL